MIIIRLLTITFLFVKFVKCSESLRSENNVLKAEIHLSVPVINKENNSTGTTNKERDKNITLNYENSDIEDKSTLLLSNVEVTENENNTMHTISTNLEFQPNGNSSNSSSTTMVQSDIEVHIPVEIIYDPPKTPNITSKSTENNKDRSSIGISNDKINMNHNVMKNVTNTNDNFVDKATKINDNIQLKSNVHSKNLADRDISNIPPESQDMNFSANKVTVENTTKMNSTSKANSSPTEKITKTVKSNESLGDNQTHILKQIKINETTYMNLPEKAEEASQHILVPYPKNISSIDTPNRSRQQRRQKETSKTEKNKIQDDILISKKLKSDDSDTSEKSSNYIPRQRIRERDPVVPIVQSENYVFSHSGDFHYSYESGDGTKAFEMGQLKNIDDNTGEAVVGSFSFIGKDGKDYSISYTADENGYRPLGDHLPTPPPIPPAIARALKYLATKTTPEPVTESTKK
ncbi:hypothetical protein ACJJTC_015770 [Scirpophaga incertulas]